MRGWGGDGRGQLRLQAIREPGHFLRGDAEAPQPRGHVGMQIENVPGGAAGESAERHFLAAPVMERSQPGDIHVRPAGADHLSQRGGFHVEDHELPAGGRGHHGQHIKPIVADGIHAVFWRDLGQQLAGAGVTPGIVGEQGELSAQRPGVHFGHLPLIGERDGARHVMGRQHFAERLAAEKVQFVTRRGGGGREFEKMNVAARDGRGKDAVADEMKPAAHDG